MSNTPTRHPATARDIADLVYVLNRLDITGKEAATILYAVHGCTLESEWFLLTPKNIEQMADDIWAEAELWETP